MRLLSIDDVGSFSLTYYPSGTTVPRYAILSHTWGTDEVTYEDLINKTGLQKRGYRKIRFCAKQAERDGLQHFWVDTCCIDKSSSAELTESINSMFRWYSDASKCYAYLEDVSGRTFSLDPIRAHGEDWRLQFQKSRWFTRGWTLQELIAPATVDFFSQMGVRLGSKESLEPLICEITGIPAQALRANQLHSYTMEEKMAWARTRETTQPEDMAYSLLGIFDIQMPLIYGEGKEKALKRLREEISKDQKGSHHEDFSAPFSLYDVPEIERFVAREAELTEIHEKLRGDGGRKTVVLYGLGGIGKTQLAVAYMKRYKDSYSAIFWFNIKDENSIKQSFARIEHQIKQRHPSASYVGNADKDANPDQTIADVKAWLNLPNNTRWLLVYDNYDNPKLPNNGDSAAVDIQKYLPEVYQGSVLVTTRSSQVEIGHGIRMQKMRNVSDSLEILSATSKRTGLGDDPDAISLARELDGLPLALATAGAYLEQTSTTFASYLNLYRDSWVRLQTSTPRLGSYADRTLHSTWQLSYDQIQRQNGNSAALLRLWAYFDNQDVWLELLQSHKKHSIPWIHEVTKDELSFTDAIRTLINYGLVEVDHSVDELIESRGYSVHSCVYSWITHVLNQEWSIDLAKYAIKCVASHFSEQESYKQWFVQRRLLQHASKYSDAILDTIIEDQEAWIYRQLGNLQRYHHKLEKAKELYDRALQADEKISGINHPSTLASLHCIGVLYLVSEKWKEAEEVLQRQLSIAQKAGCVDWQTLNIMIALGRSYREQSLLKEAEDMLQQTLQSAEEHHPGSRWVLHTLQELGLVYEKQGKPKEAEEMLQGVLKSTEEALGTDHMATVRAVWNLAYIFYRQGKLGDAQKLYRRAIQSYQKTLGPNHTSTLRAVNNLGGVLYKQGELEEAKEICRQAIQGYQKTLGPNHILTLNAVNNLGGVLYKQGELEEAEETCRQLIQGYQKTLGPNHTSTLRAVHNLGGVLYKQGELEEAEEICCQLIQSYEKTLGPDHKFTLNAIYHLGIVLENKGELEEAEEMYRQAIQGLQNTLGWDHAYTQITLRALQRLTALQNPSTAVSRTYRFSNTVGKIRAKIRLRLNLNRE
ncbi:hypothetical protein F4803DRAFT_550628 [Xylaria telfairii]|nr:hypothetical protein F4803DRAFT_550628 [Xylaria telfairii]